MQDKMNAEAKVKIVEALRSGAYTQTRGQLKLGECHCVWGVMADVSGVGKWEGENFLSAGDVNSAAAPSAVQAWAGIGELTAVVIGDRCDDLMGFNDTGATFAELADAIEQQL